MARRAPKPTGWSRPLAYPLKLRDGHTIETMKQAADLIIKQLPKGRDAKEVWQHAVELLMRANKTGSATDIRAATDQLCRGLQMEGWIR